MLWEEELEAKRIQDDEDRKRKVTLLAPTLFVLMQRFLRCTCAFWTHLKQVSHFKLLACAMLPASHETGHFVKMKLSF